MERKRESRLSKIARGATAFIVAAVPAASAYSDPANSISNYDDSSSNTYLMAKMDAAPETERDYFTFEPRSVKEGAIVYGDLPESSDKKIGENDVKFFDRIEVIKSTPEYQQIIDERVERGSGEFMRLINGATERATKFAAEYAEQAGLDILINSRGDASNGDELRDTNVEEIFEEVPTKYENSSNLGVLMGRFEMDATDEVIRYMHVQLAD